MFRLTVLLAFLGAFTLTLTGCGGPSEEKDKVVKPKQSMPDKKKIVDADD